MTFIVNMLDSKSRCDQFVEARSFKPTLVNDIVNLGHVF